MFFRPPLDRRPLPYWLLCFTFLLILSGCTSSNTSNNQPKHPTPTPTLLPGDNAGNIAGIRHFVDTWQGIHTFQTFDNNISNPFQVAKHIDFVWGAQSNKVAAYRSGNPNIFISYYIPFNRDWGVFANSSAQHDLTYWQKTHPDWVLYKCDRVTPAYEFGHSIVPLDFTNPAVVSWQVQTYAQPASKYGYDGIAADNVILQNFFGACGVYQNGHWVQLYTGQVDDPHWSASIATWLMQMQQALHHLKHPLALITNFSPGNLPLSDPQVQQIVNYSDGILDEAGFTNGGTGDLNGSDWLQRVQFIEGVQKQHKPYYIVDEFPSLDGADIQWALASYLMVKERSAALFISTIQGYGDALWYNEYYAQIGHPNDSMYQAQNVYWRDYSHGLSIVNPSATTMYSVTINPDHHYVDLYGNTVGPTITLFPHSGMVLLTNP